MKLSKNFLIIFVMLLVVFSFGLSQATAAETIKIGVILPLSGGSSIAGLEVLSGIELAMENVNAAGGVLGKQIELIKENDESIPTKGVTAAQKLITRDKVSALIGTYNSSVALPTSDVARRSKIPMISGGSTSSKVTQKNTPGDLWFFRAFPGSNSQGTQSAEDVVYRLKKTKLAILYENTAYGKSLEKTFREVTTNAGATILASDSYNHGDTDFYSQLTKLKTLKPEGIYIAGLIAEGAAILRQARELGLNTQFIGSGGLMSDQLMKLAKEGAEGFAVSTMYEPSTNNPVGAEFGKQYFKRFNKNANTHSALGYDAMSVLADAIKRAGSTDGVAIRDALVATREFKLVQGPPGTVAKFDEQGSVSFKIGLGIVKNGQRILMPY